MSAPTPLVLVGTGEYYQKILIPALTRLTSEEIVEPILTVDVKPRKEEAHPVFSLVPHRVRKEGEKLSTMLVDVAGMHPVVILGHANHLHVSDAEDLVQSGFRVLIEKPFALTREELSRLEKVIDKELPRVGLIEYYLTMKSAPLFACTGQLKKGSFFFSDGLMKVDDGGGNSSLVDSIGTIESVAIDVLEGEGLVGRLDHRGVHLIAREKGGGMIHDLGIHAIAPLIPLEDLIGELLPSTMQVRTAHSAEYVEMAKNLFGLSPYEIGESYADITLKTTKDVPVRIRVGKYVCHNENRRSLTLVGSQGSLTLDLSHPHITLSQRGEENRGMYAFPKTDEKYYSVLRTSLLELQGESPYSFRVSRSALKAQALVLHAVAMTQDRGVENLYDAELDLEDIF